MQPYAYGSGAGFADERQTRPSIITDDMTAWISVAGCATDAKDPEREGPPGGVLDKAAKISESAACWQLETAEYGRREKSCSSADHECSGRSNPANERDRGALYFSRDHACFMLKGTPERRVNTRSRFQREEEQEGCQGRGEGCGQRVVPRGP